MNKQTIRDIDVRGKKVLVRVDFNVPLDKKTNAITDDSRIRAALPTINYLIEHNARVILVSHLGRPDGKVVETLRLGPICARLSKLLGKPIAYARDCIGPDAQAKAFSLKDGEVLMLENVRFHAEEEKNDPNFAKVLANLADVFVNDAFGTAHRAHASTVGVATCLPAVAGFLMEKEIEFLGTAMENPQRPFAAIIGGAKVSDKITVLETILTKVNYLFIGGGMANTFLKAQGYQVGSSLLEEDKLDFARQMMDKAKKSGVSLYLPVDAVVADKFDAAAATKTVHIAKVPDLWMIMDIGPETIALYELALKKCKTVLWNGPVGVFEFPAFRAGTTAVAKTLAGLKGTTVMGGGSTAEAVGELGLADKMTHVSTGGGASLEFLEGRTLPGVAALLDKKKQPLLPT